MTKAEARLADNGSEQTVDRLHKDMTKAEARLADNGEAALPGANPGVGRITAARDKRRITPLALCALPVPDDERSRTSSG